MNGMIKTSLYWSLVVMVMVLLAISACGGSGGGTAVLAGGVGLTDGTPAAPVIEEQPEAAGLGGLPQDAWVDPAEILARRGSDVLQQVIPGSECFAKSNGAQVLDDVINLYPDGAGNGCWVMYRLQNLLDADYPLKFNVEFPDAPNLPEACYLGFSDYGQESWDWRTVEEPTQTVSEYLWSGDNAISPGGNLYVVVMVTGSTATTLVSLTLELNTDNPPPPEWGSVTQGSFADHVELAWHEPTETWPELEYDAVVVERAPDPAGTWERLAEVPAGTTTYTDGAGMEPGLQWYYRLRTVSGEQAGWAGSLRRGWATVADVLVIYATDGCWDRVDLSWSPVERADGYRVEYRSAGSNTYPSDWTLLAEIDDPAVTGFAHSDLEPAEEPARETLAYSYRVFASLEGSLSQGSPVDTGSFESSNVEDFTVYGTPAAVKLRWDAVDDATGYRIEYRGSSTEPLDWAPLTDVTGTTEFAHTADSPAGKGAEYNTNYAYRVKALNGTVEGRDFSVEVSGMRELGVIEWLSAGSNAEDITVVWPDADGAEGYLLEYRDIDEVDPANWTELATGPAADFPEYYTGQRSFLHCWDGPAGREARPDVYYLYRIKAYLGTEYSPEWRESSTTGHRQAVLDYSSFTASEDSLEAVRFEAGSAYRATGLKIEYRNLDGGDPVDWTLLQTTLDDHTAATPVGRECAAETNYEYRIKGTAGDAESENWLADTGRRGLFDVAGFLATDGWYAGRIVLSWEAVVGCDGYRIEYRDAAGAAPADWTLLDEPDGDTAVSFEHTTTAPSGLEAQAGVFYEYRIKARSGAAVSSNWAVNPGVCGNGPARWPQFGGNSRHNCRSLYTGPASPEVKWSQLTGGLDLVVGWGGDVITTNGSYFISYDSLGNRNWQITNFACGVAIRADGRLLAGDTSLGLYHPHGALSWLTGVGGRSITIGDDTTVYGASNGRVNAISQDGMILWSYDTGEARSTRVVQGPGGDICFGAGSELVCLNQSGELQWSYETGADAGEPVVADDGRILLLTSVYPNTTLHAVQPDGTAAWTYELDYAATRLWPVAVAADGTAFVRSDDAVISVAADGTPGWECPVTGLGQGYLLAGADGTLYAQANSGSLYAVSAAGAVVWDLALTTAEATVSYPLVPGGDGLLYVVTTDESGYYSLFAIGEV